MMYCLWYRLRFMGRKPLH